MPEDVIVQPLNLPSQSFKWHTSWDKTNHSNTKITSCRNSVQGKVLIADDKGEMNSDYLGFSFKHKIYNTFGIIILVSS